MSINYENLKILWISQEESDELEDFQMYSHVHLVGCFIKCKILVYSKQILHSLGIKPSSLVFLAHFTTRYRNKKCFYASYLIHYTPRGYEGTIIFNE